VKNLVTNQYYYQDASGSTSHLADSTGHLLEWYRYDLQGTPTVYDPGNSQLSTAPSVRHLFTGQQWYSEIGLYDLRHRFYSPDIGRFLQADPISFIGDAGNLYRYVKNNALTHLDPSGLAGVGSPCDTPNCDQKNENGQGTPGGSGYYDANNGMAPIDPGQGTVDHPSSLSSSSESEMGRTVITEGPPPVSYGGTSRIDVYGGGLPLGGIVSGSPGGFLGAAPAVDGLSVPATGDLAKLLPHSSGVVVGADVNAGIWSGGSASITAEGGMFTPDAGGVDRAAFYSYGAWGGTPNDNLSAVDTALQSYKTVYGASASVTAGAWVSNAQYPNDKLGPFATYNVTTPWFSASYAYSYSQSGNYTYVFTLSAGGPGGFSYSAYPTTTKQIGH
jgi:RHS repeat-associated protein